MRILAFFALGVFLSGCVSNSDMTWEKKYTPSNDMTDSMPYSGSTVCIRSLDGNPFEDIKMHYRNGYTSIGGSVVGSIGYRMGSADSISELEKFGKSLGADRISYGIFEETNLGITTNGSVSSSGSFNSTTRNRVSTFWYANYWRKSKPDEFNIEAKFRNLTEDEAKKIGSRAGAVVLVVIRGGPAFLSDIFEGDILTEFNGEKVLTANDFRNKCKSKGGDVVTLTIVRNGAVIKKAVKLNS